MNTTHALACLAVAGPLLTATLALPAFDALDSQDATAEPTKLAVVDVLRVMREAPELVAANDELVAWVEAERAPLENMKREIDRLEAELQVFDPSSAEFVERSYELDRRKLAFDHEYELRDRRRAARIVESRTDAFGRVREAAEAVAEEQGIQLVLQIRGKAPQALTEAELLSEIVVRQVVVHAAELDITPDVISMLGR